MAPIGLQFAIGNLQLSFCNGRTNMMRLYLVIFFLFLVAPVAKPGGKEGGGVEIDKAKRLIKIDAKIAPRKLPHLSKIYEIEVIACWPHPKGKKAHETVVTIEAKPSTVHKGLA